MAITRNQKVKILEDLQGEVTSQPTVVLLTAKDAKTGLDAISNSEMRRQIRKNGVKVQVVKNTLIRRVFSSVPELFGPTYLAYMVGNTEADEVTVPKAVVNVVEENYKDKISVLGSVVNGEFYSGEQTIQLSKVPSFTESMAMVAGSLNAVTAKLARTIKEVPSSVARGVSEYSKTLS